MKIEDTKKFANYYFPRVSYLAQSQPKITSKLLKYIYAKKKIHRNSKSLKYNISRISYVILSKHTSCHSTKLPPPPPPNNIFIEDYRAIQNTSPIPHFLLAEKQAQKITYLPNKSETSLPIAEIYRQSAYLPCNQNDPTYPFDRMEKMEITVSSKRYTIRTCRGSDHRSPATGPRVFVFISARTAEREKERERKRWSESLEGGRRPRILVIGPGESRLGERRASDWLSHDPPEVPEAIQDPLLLRYNFHDTHG